jgi:hypothetical protein
MVVALMTPDELRSLADEAAREPKPSVDVWVGHEYMGTVEREAPATLALTAAAPDLARLCAEAAAMMEGLVLIEGSVPGAASAWLKQFGDLNA